MSTKLENMKIDLRPATTKDVDILLNLFQFYIYDMSKIIGKKVGESGKFSFNQDALVKYWENTDHWAYLVYMGEDIAGFCLVRKYPEEKEVYDIEQFFMLNSFKSMRVGTQVFDSLMLNHPGKWLIRVLKENTGALRFWLKVVRGQVGNNYTSSFELDEDLEMHFIRYEFPSI